MSLNLCQICQVLYPGQVEAGNIGFSDPLGDGDLTISYWAVPNIAQPTDASLLAQESECEQPYALLMLDEQIWPALEALLDSVASARQYLNAIYCLSFFNSLNATWKADAEAFSIWRDSVRTYYFTQYAIYSVPGAVIPSFDDYMSGVPVITWPS
jgi:hypothetical protein